VRRRVVFDFEVPKYSSDRVHRDRQAAEDSSQTLSLPEPELDPSLASRSNLYSECLLAVLGGYPRSLG